MPIRTRQRFRFGRHTLDLSTVELLVDGRPVEVEPLTFSVLAHLVANRHRAVPKEELLDAVWGDRFVSESALTTQIKHCRRVLGDDGRAQQVIRTLHRIGYRFVADVDEEPDPAQAPTGPPMPTATAPATAAAARVPKPVFGRDHDLLQVLDRLDDHRLVTITGAGGIGKSELCRQVIERYDTAGRRAPWVCELASAADPRALPLLLLDALGEGQHSDADPVESLLRILEDRDGLLVLDGCEHLVEVAGPVVGNVLRRCPGIRVLATSRRPLGTIGESVLALDPLEDDAARACFASRATDAGATVDPADPALAELCRRLDGIPLAIELAAARARLLSPADMLDMLHDRFRLLRAPEDLAADDERHRSLHATIAWSWHDLTPADQRLLSQLSTLAGSFGIEDATGVALDGGDPLDVVDGLERLVHRSLLEAKTSAAGTRRFRLLDSIRDFVRCQLAPGHAERARHVAHFTGLAEHLDDCMQTGDVDAALDRMGEAWDDLRVAVGCASSIGDVASARRIVRAVAARADLFQTYEVLDWCNRADLAAPDPADLLAEERAMVADALAVQARLLAHRGEQVRARTLAAEARALHESHHTVLSTIWCAYYAGDLDRVVQDAPRLRQLSRTPTGLDAAYADGFTAVVATVRQEPVIESTPVTPAAAERGVLGTLECLTAGFRLCTADPERAAELLEAVVTMALERDHRLLLGAAASTLTQITLPARPAPEAMRTLQRTLQRYRERSMWVLISADTVMAAKLLADAGDQDTAARLIGARDASGYGTGLSEALRDAVSDQLAAALGSEALTRLTAEGARWAPPRAAEVAIEALRRHTELSRSAEP
jgi:predicted ATPase/DNA-binding winged helix-turn-helix (wHTH) protein